MSDLVLIDTSAWIEAIRSGGDSDTALAVRRALSSERAAVCDIVLVELWNGARRGGDQRTIREIESTIERLPITDQVWSGAAALARAARAIGVSVPTPDLVVAACASHHGAGLLHRDAHFDALAKLAAKR